MQLAEHWLRGRGIELGRAAHNPLAPADCLSVAPSDGVTAVDSRDLEDYKVYVAEQARHGREPARVDVVAEATALPFADGELDYVASSHVLEHVPDIFTAWLEWWRVLKPGGVNFMIVPKRDATTEDSVRPITGLEAHIDAFQRRLTPDNLFPGLPWRTHYHVFTLQGLLAALNWFNQQGMGGWLLLAQEETDSNVGNGHTLVLRKTAELPPLAESAQALSGHFGQQRYAEAEQRAAEVLSLNFRVHEAWFMHAMCRWQAGDPACAAQSLTQALVLQPRNVDYQQAYQQLTGHPFHYPMSLIDYLSRLL
ncbi:class I SAM-dependent methyltransferase [uncultured Aquitalea sp.]|uniref:class I SAM-dependent methyltransferase n=1 Tax=uncultured Aquitalea sp. TaxID=540272 RepID=UPI0025E74884|nr:class I SAM-dependent methyltransferase [uncultured Aquitalea sp.]